MNQNIKAHLAIIGANTIYGLNIVIAKGIMPDYLAPRAMIFLRIAGTTLLFWLLHLFIPWRKVAARDLLKIAVCSLFGIAINQILFFEGLSRSAPISASLIVTTSPIVILIFSYLLLKERITGSKVVGILLGAAGALTVILSAGLGDLRGNTLLGNVMVFANSVSWGLYLVLVRPLMEKYDSQTLMKWVFLFGLIITSPLTLGVTVSTSFVRIPWHIWLAILFVVFITSAVAYWLINYSLKTLSPNINGIYIYLQPLVASLTAVVFGKDTLTVVDFLAAALIASGVYLVTWRPKLRNQPKPVA
ncbi:MAG: DMT family transporter [Deltaproteobacteria bacterium]|nr:DMT family transporter [Deltaproteobacteria bacterium]